MSITVHCRGARGSVSVSGPMYHKYGGATTCFEFDSSEDRRVLIDAGTGLLSLMRDLPDDRPLQFSLVFTHLHWDHCIALPFFGPLYDPRNRFDFYGRTVGGMDIEEAIDRVMRPPWFPVNFRSTPADKRFHYFEPYTNFQVEDYTFHPILLHHPDGVTGYRITRGDTTVVMATDVEHGVPESDAALRELARGADLLIYDAQYVPDQYEAQKVGWGHSTWQEGVKLAQAAGVKKLMLTSHDPARTDDEIDEILRLAQAVFPDTVIATEGVSITVG